MHPQHMSQHMCISAGSVQQVFTGNVVVAPPPAQLRIVSSAHYALAQGRIVPIFGRGRPAFPES